jgi:hypothetical protein
MRPEAAIIEVAPVRHEKLWRTVKDNLAKSHEHLKVAGEALLQLKADHDAQGGTWAEWEALVKEKAGIRAPRASELMQIADGRKTVEEMRAGGAARKAEHDERKKISSLRNEEDAATPGASAERMKAKFAELDGAEIDGSPVPEEKIEEESGGGPVAAALRLVEQMSAESRESFFSELQYRFPTTMGTRSTKTQMTSLLSARLCER